MKLIRYLAFVVALVVRTLAELAAGVAFACGASHAVGWALRVAFG